MPGVPRLVGGGTLEIAMIELSQRFSFDAAHHLDAGASENRRMHGHSFYVEANPRKPIVVRIGVCNSTP